MACDKATELLDLHTAALGTLRRAKSLPVAAGLDDEAVRELRNRAFDAVVVARSLYREHVKEHGCGNPDDIRAVVPDAGWRM